jgi:peptidoglycan-N-acetylglucosamine deacetylase
MFLGLGAAGLTAAAALRLGLKSSADNSPRNDVLLIDENDPSATPVLYAATSTPTAPPVLYAATSTPTAPATPTATAPPTPTTSPGRPAWTSDLLRQVARSGPTDRPYVGLTIDDGWSAQDEVLKALTDRNVRPTLFLTGRAVKNDPQFIARSIGAGCEIGNHTMDHAWLLDKTKDYIQKDIRDFEAFVKSVAPNATTLPFMRPSGGAVNQTVIDASAELGYRPILWSASTGDGSTSTAASQMVQNALAGAKPGAILVTHFSRRTVAALPGIIDGLRAKGLEPVSLTRLFGAPS